MELKLSKDQQKIINYFENQNINKIKNRIVLINGGAGTGKSYVINKLRTILKLKGYAIKVIAPTGKASIKIEGQTIHSFFEPKLDEEKTRRYKEEVFYFTKKSFENETILIVDESSMINQELYEKIMYLQNRTLIIFVGDEGQLPPINKDYKDRNKKPFIEMLKNKYIKHFNLTTIHRTKDGNDINVFAWRFRRGEYAFDFPYKNILIREQKGLWDKLSKMDDEKIINNQIIVPTKKNNSGTYFINNLVQRKRRFYFENKKGKTLDFLFDIWKKHWEKNQRKYIFINQGSIYENDKIIFEKNVSFEFENGEELQIYNGEIGIISNYWITKKTIDFVENSWKKNICYLIKMEDGRKIFVPKQYLIKNSTLAYAITIHKAQGSEWKHIFFFFNEEWLNQKFFDKTKMFYTAITRAMKYLIFVL